MFSNSTGSCNLHYFAVIHPRRGLPLMPLSIGTKMNSQCRVGRGGGGGGGGGGGICTLIIRTVFPCSVSSPVN